MRNAASCNIWQLILWLKSKNKTAGQCVSFWKCRWPLWANPSLLRKKRTALADFRCGISSACSFSRSTARHPTCLLDDVAAHRSTLIRVRLSCCSFFKQNFQKGLKLLLNNQTYHRSSSTVRYKQDERVTQVLSGLDVITREWRKSISAICEYTYQVA